VKKQKFKKVNTKIKSVKRITVYVKKELCYERTSQFCATPRVIQLSKLVPLWLGATWECAEKLILVGLRRILLLDRVQVSHIIKKTLITNKYYKENLEKLRRREQEDNGNFSTF
jgi:hypothetical protein